MPVELVRDPAPPERSRAGPEAWRGGGGGGARARATPLKANAIRINENIRTILENIVGITKDARGTIVWAADEVVYTPEIAVRGVHVDEIATFMEELD